MAAFFGGTEMVAELLELSAREHDLGHVEANAELCLGDVAASELVEVAEELSHASALLLAEHADAGEHVVHVVGSQLNEVRFDLAWLSAGVVVKRLVVGTANTEHALVSVNVIAEVDIVNLFGVSFVHVALGDQSKDVFRGEDAELSKHSEELALAHMTALGNVEVLELGLQVDAAVLDCSAILRDEGLNLVLFLS